MKETTDMWFASFLMMNDHPVANFEVIRRGRGKFYFDVSEAEWKLLKLEFNDSVVHTIKMNHLTLKDMVH